MVELVGLVSAVLEAVNGTCPCRHLDGILLDAADPHICNKPCPCVQAVRSGLLPALVRCSWPGHSRVRAVLREKVIPAWHVVCCICLRVTGVNETSPACESDRRAALALLDKEAP